MRNDHTSIFRNSFRKNYHQHNQDVVHHSWLQEKKKRTLHILSLEHYYIGKKALSITGSQTQVREAAVLKVTFFTHNPS